MARQQQCHGAHRLSQPSPDRAGSKHRLTQVSHSFHPSLARYVATGRAWVNATDLSHHGGTAMRANVSAIAKTLKTGLHAGHASTPKTVLLFEPVLLRSWPIS